MGWLTIAAPSLLSQFNPLLWFWAFVIGLPISYFVCWTVVSPILGRIMRNPISWTSAACWGAIISSFIAAIAIAIDRYWGWKQSVNPTFQFYIWRHGVKHSANGILTPDGWLWLFQSTFVFVLEGVVIALILRLVIGPGETSRNSDGRVR